MGELVTAKADVYSFAMIMWELIAALATPTFAFFATLRGRVEPAWPRRACTGQPAGRAGTAPQAASRALPRDCARAHNRP